MKNIQNHKTKIPNFAPNLNPQLRSWDISEYRDLKRKFYINEIYDTKKL